MRILEGHTGDIETSSLVFSPDGKLLASGSKDKTARLWDPATGDCRAVLEGHNELIDGVVFALDGTALLTGSWDKTIRVWDPADPAKQPRVIHAEGPVCCLAISPDGKTVAATGGGWSHGGEVVVNSIWRWDVASGRQLPSVGQHVKQIGAVVFGGDNKWIASGSADKTTRVWDVETGKERAIIPHKHWVQGLASSPDGRWLASAAWWTVKMWDSQANRVQRELKGHTETVISVAFSPDGRKLASAGKDGKVFLWEVESGRKLAQFQWDIGPLQAICFAPDGLRLAAGGDGHIVIWDGE